MDITYYNKLNMHGTTTAQHNRILKQKQYKIIQHRRPTMFKKIDYEFKIKSLNNENTDYLIKLEGQQDVVDVEYVNYLFYRHLKNMVKYMANRGVYLIDIEQNIKLVLNKITTGVVKEEHYEKLIDQYDNLSGGYVNIYDVIDRAIDFNNYEILYYIYYMEEEETLKSVFKVIYK